MRPMMDLVVAETIAARLTRAEKVSLQLMPDNYGSDGKIE